MTFAKSAVLHLALALLASCASAPSPGDPCYYDREAVLALSYDEFDGDAGAWRRLADQDACIEVAADLLEAFRVERGTNMRQTRSLVHHEAQLRAALGESRRAVRMLRTLLPLSEDTPEMLAYHEAEIAFLENDRTSLQAARDRLAALPPPAGFAEGVESFKARYPDMPAPVWPLNLDVVDGFLNCFNKPYAEAYSTECRPSAN